MELTSLFGEEFNIKIEQPKVNDLIKKVKDEKNNDEQDVSKTLKSKKISLRERLLIIKDNVFRVLGKQKENVLVIKDINTFIAYITKAIEFGRIAIDTETDNSLDPITCKLMGLCLYVPGEKQVYIPINHRDPDSKERLTWQLTEADCNKQLQRVLDSKIDIIMHNGKFDYEVIKCTCGIDVRPTWDTIVCARLLNENEPAGLKWQYINKIDQSQEKYSIDHLFEDVMYADVDPDIFALYAATDAMETDKLYEVQYEELKKDEYGQHLDISGKHTVNGLRWLFHEIEMPIVWITAEMELAGVHVDTDLGERLHNKYNNKLNSIDKKIDDILVLAKDLINDWKLSKEANEKTKVYVAAKTKMTEEKIIKSYPEIDENGNRFKYGKARIEQLTEPINLSSPTQLAILLFDVFKSPLADKDSRATGEEELKTIVDSVKDIFIDKKKPKPKDMIIPPNPKLIVDLCKLVLERRGILKLITTYIDVIPELVKHWPDGRIRFHMNALGTDTGRYSSGGKIRYTENDLPIEVSGINIQNIPSHGDGVITRLLFTGDTKNHTVEITDDYYIIPETDEVETAAGWKKVQELSVGDVVIGQDTEETITKIIKDNCNYLLYTTSYIV